LSSLILFFDNSFFPSSHSSNNIHNVLSGLVNEIVKILTVHGELGNPSRRYDFISKGC
jgi:hypothetical protein